MAQTPDWEYVTETFTADDGYPYGMAHRVKIGHETLTIGTHSFGIGGKCESELAARGRLLAAAPDLLAALEKLLWSVEHYTNMPYANAEEYEFDQEEIQEARAALRKAKGE